MVPSPPGPAPEAYLCSFLWDRPSRRIRTTTKTTRSAPTAPTIPYTMLLLVLDSQVSPEYQCVSEFRHLGTHTSSGRSASFPHPPNFCPPPPPPHPHPVPTLLLPLLRRSSHQLSRAGTAVAKSFLPEMVMGCNLGGPDPKRRSAGPGQSHRVAQPLQRLWQSA